MQAAIIGLRNGTLAPEDIKIDGIDSEEEKKAKEAAGILPRAPAKPRASQIAPMKMSSGVDSSGSRDATPSNDAVAMSISEKIKFEGRNKKGSSAAPTSSRATPVPVPAIATIAKPFNKRGTAAPLVKRSHKKQKRDRKSLLITHDFCTRFTN